MFEGRLIPHTFLSAGYRFFLSDDFSFLPSTLIKYVNPTPLSFDVNAKFQYQDFLWAGASYRYKDGFAAMLGINISNSLNVGYSYDYTTSNLNLLAMAHMKLLLAFSWVTGMAIGVRETYGR